MPRVLHVFGLMNRGGAELRTIDLMREEALSDHEFHFATLGAGSGTLDSTIRELGGEVRPCELGKTFSRRFRQLLRTGGYDVVHSHVHLFSGYILRLAKKEGVRTRIAHLWTTGDGHASTPWRLLQRRIMTRWVEKYATTILANGEGAMSSWRPDWQKDPRCRVIYNGFRPGPVPSEAERSAVRSELGIPADSAMILHVGLLSAWKNQERLLGIFECLTQHRTNIHLILVGRDGGALTRIKSTIKRRGLEDAVLLLGERADVPRLMRASDAMVFPSTREGLPGAVLEACVAGLPVLASTVPGAEEIAAHVAGVNCISLSAADVEWAEATLKILTSPPPATSLCDTPFEMSVAAQAMRSAYVS